MRLFSNDIYAVIAESVAEAREIVTNDVHGYTCSYEDLSSYEREEVDYMGWHEVPEDSDFTLRNGDERFDVTKKVSEWLLTEPKGLLAIDE